MNDKLALTTTRYINQSINGRRMLDGRKNAIGLYYYYFHLRPKDHR
jgi:hypothetical protein